MVSSQLKQFPVNNSGTDAAIINTTTLSTNGGTVTPTITANNCGNSIAIGQNCSISVTYGPAATSLSANESGIANLNISYHGGTPIPTYCN